MSYRINRAMGWGMPLRKFVELTLLDKSDPTEALWELMRHVEAEDLVVPIEEHERVFYSESPRPPPYFQLNLGSKEYEFLLKDDPKKSFGNPHNLYAIAMTPYNITDIIFFPSVYYGSKWMRRDNDMDYQFEAYREADGNRVDRDEPRDFTKYLGYNHYPWSNFLMLEDGTPVKWDHFTVVNKHPEWLPAVPSEIRWYLSKLKIFDSKGINELRPVISQWWC